jgi:energy-coupling factor transport system permease protein
MTLFCELYPATLDIRTKLSFVTISGCAALAPFSPASAALTLFLVLPFLGIQGQWKLFILLILGVPAAWGVNILLLRQGSVVSVLVAYAFFFIVKTLPLMCLCASSIGSTKLSELMALLEKSRLPQSVIVSVAVTCRFIPTLVNEYGRIRDAMRIRELRGGIARLVHPIRQAESVLLPLITRATRLSDELAASAMTRGIESPTRRKYRLSSLGAGDLALMAWAAAAAVVLAGISVTEAFR